MIMKSKIIITPGRYKQIKNIKLLDELPCTFTYKEAKEVGISTGDLVHFRSLGLIKSGSKPKRGVSENWIKVECVVRKDIRKYPNKN